MTFHKAAAVSSASKTVRISTLARGGQHHHGPAQRADGRRRDACHERLNSRAMPVLFEYDLRTLLSKDLNEWVLE